MATKRKRTPAPVTNPGGRPSDYRPEYDEQVYRLALLGLTDAEIADFFEVNELTINRWKIAHPEFCKSLTRGKLPADAEVAAKLYHRAIGYSHEAVKIFMPAGFDAPVYAPYTEHFPPDTNAGSLWLRNRQRGHWRDKVDVEHSGELTLREIIAASMGAKDKPK